MIIDRCRVIKRSKCPPPINDKPNAADATPSPNFFLIVMSVLPPYPRSRVCRIFILNPKVTLGEQSGWFVELFFCLILIDFFKGRADGEG